METSTNEPRKKTWSTREKSLTRLQNHAPAALQLDGIAKKVKIDSTRAVIPLLSPLILSPPRLIEAKESELASGENDKQGSSNKEQDPWQNHAVGAMAEPSTLHTLFQFQCSLVNNLQ
ncbi:Hypothetical predicted protein [Olea europaea subsp. europaea]|uniref:Uncharacterized protein n=1 Tax=Olea europaea subsp. europaea TaxID=158383 RepID=A0A8S0RVL1_OLEEU|nr:Hypothetical predicted protein [Olea europaea subsp. europaea]